MYSLHQRPCCETAHLRFHAYRIFLSNILIGSTLIFAVLAYIYKTITFDLLYRYFGLLQSMILAVFNITQRRIYKRCISFTNEERLLALPEQPTRNKISVLSEKQLSGEAVEKRISLRQLKLQKPSAFLETELSQKAAVQQLTSNKPNVLSENVANKRISVGRLTLREKSEFSENLLSEDTAKERSLLGQRSRKKPSVLAEKRSSTDACKEGVLPAESTCKKLGMLSKRNIKTCSCQEQER